MNFRSRGPAARATTVLILANCAIFLGLQLLGPQWTLWTNFNFGLSDSGLQAGYYWQLVTHQFLHGGEVHLIVNMLALWFAGRELERVLGRRRFLCLYFGGGIVGGLAQVWLIGGGAPLVGASGSVCAVLLCLTTLFPEIPVTALVFFILPIRTKAKFIGYGLVAASVILWISGFAPMIGHWAHLGGFAFGYLFAKGVIWHERRIFALQEGPTLKSRGAFPTGRDSESLDDLDGVLAKVMRRGIGALTKSELRLLESSRIRRTRKW